MFKFLSRSSLIIVIAVLVAGSNQAYASNGISHSPFPEPEIIADDDEDPDERLAALVKYLQEQGFDIQPLLEDSRFKIYENIDNRFRRSAEKKSHTLDSYKKILGFNAKADNIISFIENHSNQLAKAEEEYGVSRYVIAAILGVESDFGEVRGSYNPFNAYASMFAVNYRSDFAKAQLSELMKFVQRHELDVFELKSSYAGAMAFAQFIPYSLNKWFVGTDILDMNNNIMSVGNYLAYFKERTGDIKTAVFRYNPSDMYTRAVLDLAQAAEVQLAQK